jgi:hypothetical protein
MARKGGVGRWVLIGVGAFVAVDLVVIAWFESRPRPAPAPAASSPVAAATPEPVDTAASQRRPEAPTARKTEPAAGTPRVAAGVVTATTVSTPNEAPPSPEELRSLGESIFAAIRNKDEIFLKEMAPPGAATDETTIKMYMHERNLGHLREVAPKLEAISKEKGIDQILTMRGGELRLKLYPAEGATSGKALSMRRRDDGGWYIVQEVYMRD